MSCQMKRDVYIPELRTKLSTATTQLVNVPLVAASIHWLKLPTLISLQFERATANLLHWIRIFGKAPTPGRRGARELFLGAAVH